MEDATNKVEKVEKKPTRLEFYSKRNRMNIKYFLNKFFREQPSQVITSFTTSIGLIVATFLLIQTCNQVQVSKNALVEAKRATDSVSIISREGLYLSRQIAEANESSTNMALAISNSSLALSKSRDSIYMKAVRMDNRAYISVPDIYSDTLKNGEVVLVCEFKNCGKTPAYKVRGLIDFEMCASEDSLDSNYFIQQISGNGFVISPDQKMKLTIPFYEKPGYKNKSIVNSGGYTIIKPKLFFYGRILYEDVFKIPHYINFCSLYNPWNDSFNPIDIYNNADH